jgi:putative ABC transport system permease protein
MRRSLRSWLWRIPVDQEVDEEIALHIELRTRELVERGMDPSVARSTAMKRLGDVAALKRTCADLGRKRDRGMRLTQWFDELRDDVKFAVRQMRQSPTFTVIAVATLALGIGANGAIFALVDAALLRPLPLPHPDRLVMLWERSETSARDGVSPLNLLDWSEQGRTFDHMGGFVAGVGGMVMNGRDGTAETVPRQWVTSGVFQALGVTPVAGRTFRPTDNRQGSRVVVLSEAFWRARFDGDTSLVGRDIRLDGSPYTVVGIVPDESELLGRSSIWALAPMDHSAPPALRGAHFLRVIGRLKPGVTLEAARADMAAVSAGLARTFPQTNKGRGVVIEPLHDALIGSELQLTSMLFLGVVGFVLLICCANVANLLLARATARARELAIRAALGAGRRRVIRQLLTESLVLAIIGGAFGAAVGAAILSVAPSVVPPGLLPGAVTLGFDTRVMAFCGVTALLVGLLFGLAPAWQATGLSSVPAMSAGGRTVTGTGGGIRALLVGGEVATAVLLLVGAGLLLRTLVAVEHVDRGYRARRVLTMMVDPLGSHYPTEASLMQFFEDIEREVTAVPGVYGVAWTSALPLGPSDNGESFVGIAGEPPMPESQRPIAEYQIASPAYFRTLDIPVVAGRGFTDRDRAGSVPVCMVNEAFVRRYLGKRSPVGLRVSLRPTDAAEAPSVVREIVGVARQVKTRPDEKEDIVQVYVPLAQDPRDDMYFLVRPISMPAEALAPPVRAAIGRVDKEQLVSVRGVMTLEDIAWEATGRHRFRAVMVVTFAALALVLAMVGVFGVLAYSVQQRVRDIAVRRALGATTADVFRLVVGSAARVVIAGGVVGLVLAALLARLLATVLFGVQPLDPLTFASVIGTLIVTAAVATLAPAWRASRIDPAAALRTE